MRRIGAPDVDPINKLDIMLDTGIAALGYAVLSPVDCGSRRKDHLQPFATHQARKKQVYGDVILTQCSWRVQGSCVVTLSKPASEKPANPILRVPNPMLRASNAVTRIEFAGIYGMSR